MSNTTGKPLLSTGVMTRIAILAAAASILFLLEIPIVAFYKLDLSNIPVLLGAFSMGTVPGLIILGLKSAIGLLHSSSAGVGELADFIMGTALLIPASLIYSAVPMIKSREQVHYAALLHGRVPYGYGRDHQGREGQRDRYRMETAAADHRAF